MSGTIDKPKFMILLRHPTEGPGPTPEELRGIMDQFAIWMKGLRERNAVVGTHGLGDTGAVLRGARGAMILDGPYLESKEVVGGYVIVSATDLKEAIEFARECPGLAHRLTLEVRPLRPCDA